MKTLKTTWTPLWHIYQPPNQTRYWLEKIAKESYEQIINLYKKHPHAKLVLNINGSLTELLLKHKLYHIIQGFKELAEKGQLEFVSTLCYHAIAPLIPTKEVIRQIKLNDEINKKAFGEAYKPSGVWLPEMAYSKIIIPPIANLGYKWISLPGVSTNGSWTNDGYKYIEHAGKKLKVLFRDDRLSLKMAFGNIDENFVNELRQQKGTYLFTTMDGETIGHHIPKLLPILDKVFADIGNSQDLQMMTASELLENYPEQGKALPLPSSWSTTYEDIKQGNFYPLWLEQKTEPFKTAHELAWQHLYTLLEASETAKKESEEYKKARKLIDRCLFSCSYWWFSREAGHRSLAFFLSNIDMQTKAFRLLLKEHPTEEIHEYLEEAEQTRQELFELLINHNYMNA